MYISLELILVILFIFVVWAILNVWSKLILKNKIKKLFYNSILTFDGTFRLFDQIGTFWYDSETQKFHIDIPYKAQDENE